MPKIPGAGEDMTVRLRSEDAPDLWCAVDEMAERLPDLLRRQIVLLRAAANDGVAWDRLIELREGAPPPSGGRGAEGGGAGEVLVQVGSGPDLRAFLAALRAWDQALAEFERRAGLVPAPDAAGTAPSTPSTGESGPGAVGAGEAGEAAP